MINKLNVVISAAIILATSSTAFAMTDNRAVAAKYTSQVDPQSLNLGYGQTPSGASMSNWTAPAYRMSTMASPSAEKTSIDHQYLGYGVPHS